MGTAGLAGLLWMPLAPVSADSLQATTGVRWERVPEDAAKLARQTGRPMLLEFWADWCAACDVMDAQVYPDPRVIEALSHVVAVRVDADARTDFVGKYGVLGLPTLVYTDSYGNELLRHVGFIDAADLARLLRALPRDLERINALGRRIAERGPDFETLAGMGDELRAAQLFGTSNGYYSRALRASGADDRAHTDRRGSLLIDMGSNHLAVRDFTAAVAAFEQYLREFPGGGLDAEARLGLGQAWLGQGREDEARPILEQLLHLPEAHPLHGEARRILASL